MKYLLLLTNDADEIASWEHLTPEEARRADEESEPVWNAAIARMSERGRLLGGLELAPPSAAKTVRGRGGELLVTDGPYAETREQLGGYFLVECESLDDAIAMAELVPVARTGAVEIRPLVTEEERP